ncbi:FAD-dependent oxidoreductase [Vibrio lentus]|nr:FAD-dependent oxidoreductase [Vibrio lentus]
MGERGGIVINDHCQTNIDNVYAIGECALWDNKIFRLSGTRLFHGEVAASHILLEGTKATLRLASAPT